MKSACMHWGLILIGDPAHSTDDSTGFIRPKIFHAFSRIHGDLERDYNNFVVEQSYWSQVGDCLL